MKDRRTKFIISLIIFYVIAQTFVLVLFAERAKKLQKAQLDRQYNSDISNSLNQYSKEYQDQINSVKAQYAEKMKAAQEQYNALLKQQPSIIAQHTRQVAEGQSGGNGSVLTTVSSNSSNSAATVSVSKPKSAPKTRSS